MGDIPVFIPSGQDVLIGVLAAFGLPFILLVILYNALNAWTLLQGGMSLYRWANRVTAQTTIDLQNRREADGALSGSRWRRQLGSTFLIQSLSVSLLFLAFRLMVSSPLLITGSGDWSAYFAQAFSLSSFGDSQQILPELAVIGLWAPGVLLVLFLLFDASLAVRAERFAGLLGLGFWPYHAAMLLWAVVGFCLALYVLIRLFVGGPNPLAGGQFVIVISGAMAGIVLLGIHRSLASVEQLLGQRSSG